MPPLLDRKLRFSDAAYAIEATPKTLRNWLQRDQVKFEHVGDSEAAKAGGWREFTIMEIAVLAITRKLVDFGMTVEEASSYADAILGDRASLLISYKHTPPAVLVATFKGLLLVAWRDPPGGAWGLSLVRADDFELPSSACVILSVADVLDRAIFRAYAGRSDNREEGEDGLKAGLEKLIITIQDATPGGDAE